MKILQTITIDVAEGSNPASVERLRVALRNTAYDHIIMMADVLGVHRSTLCIESTTTLVNDQ